MFPDSDQIALTGTVREGTWAILLLLLIAVSQQQARAQAMDYYVYSNGNILPVRDGNPDRIQPSYWVVWVFYDRNEGTALKGTKCGAHDGKTAGQAVEAAKNYLNFNIKWAKYIYGSAWQSNLTNCSGRSMQGPIAVMGDEVRWNPAKIPESLSEANEQVQLARETWLGIKEVLDSYNPRLDPKEENPFEHAGSVLKEYSKNLQEATSLLNNLVTRVLNGATLRGMDATTSRLSDALAALRNARQLALAEIPQLNERRATGSTAQRPIEQCGQAGVIWSNEQHSCVCEHQGWELHRNGKSYYCTAPLVVSFE